VVGSTLANRYRILTELGSGGAGAVYKALDITLRRPVAVKMLHPEKTASQQLLQRFYREARKASQLSHPNSVTVHDFGRTDDGTFFLVMEYLRGFSLKQVQQMERSMRPGRVVHIVRQVCDSLGEAHGLGMVHRDLKPDNIFLTAKGEQRDVVKLVDFGLAKTLGSETDHVTRKGTPGTPNYMSPEQISQGEADARSDLYSLGAVMYAVLAGAPVFTGRAKMVDVLWAHVNEAPQPLSERVGDGRIPADLEAVVLKCLAKAPNDRYQSAHELKAALEATVVADTWDESRSVQSWAHYDISLEDDDLSFDDLPTLPEEVSPVAAKPVTFESTGLRHQVTPEDERKMADGTGRTEQDDTHRDPVRPGMEDDSIPWGLLVAVSAAVAILTAGLVVWFLRSSTGG